MSDDMPKRIEVIFQDATHNLQFFKQQQWTVTNYALAAYAALFALAHIAEDTGPGVRVIVIAAISLVSVYSIVILSLSSTRSKNLEAALNGFTKSTLSARSALHWGSVRLRECSTDSDLRPASYLSLWQEPSSLPPPFGTGHNIPG